LFILVAIRMALAISDSVRGEQAAMLARESAGSSGPD